MSIVKTACLIIALFLSLLSSNAQEWSFVGNGIEGGQVDVLHSFNQKLYAGTHHAGVFVSEDQGESWKASNNGLREPQVTGIVSIGDTLYAGTDLGVHWSFDEGATWELTPDQSDFPQIRAMMARNGVLFAGTFRGMRRSDDRGETWNPVESINIDGDPFVDVDAIEDLGDVIFVGVSFNSGFLSYDDGESWSFITAVPENEYLTSGIALDDVLILGTGEGAIRSLDNGATWEEVSWVNNARAREFANVDGVVFAATSIGILRSDDQGASWVKTHGNSYIRSASILYKENNLFIGTTQDGILKTDDLGETFTEKNVGLTAQVVNSAITHKEKLYVFTSSRDLYRTENGVDWESVGIPIGSIRTPYSKGDTLITGSDGSGIYFSTDEGSTWGNVPTDGLNTLGTNILHISGSDIYAVGNSLLYVLRGGNSTWEEIVPEAGLRFPREMIEMNSVLYLYYSSGIFTSEDQGNTWQRLSDEGIENCCSHRALRLLNDNIILSHSPSTIIYFSEDGGESWSLNLTESRGWGNLEVSEGANLAFGYGFGFGFSPDDGRTWKTLNEGLPERVNFHTIQAFEDYLYLGGDGGVWSIPVNVFYPTINSISTSSANSGETVIVTGSNFSAVDSYNQVTINEVPAEIVSAASDRLTFSVPADVISGRISLAVNGRTTVSNDTLCINLGQPTITSSMDGDGNTILTSSNDDGNEWFLDGERIDGADTKEIMAVDEGIYTVSVSDGVCQSIPSDPFTFIILNTTIDQKIRPYPNPTTDLLTIELGRIGVQDLAIELADLSGKKIPMTYDIKGNQLFVDLTQYGRGTYILTLTHQSGQQVFKVSKE